MFVKILVLASLGAHVQVLASKNLAFTILTQMSIVLRAMLE